MHIAGEHAILFLFASETQQGIFEFVHNLSSIVARISFSSIERTAMAMFADAKSDRAQCRKIWTMLMRISLLISLLYIALCPAYITFLIHLVYGSKWSSTDAPNLVAFYGLYLLLMGINGLIESLRDAVAPDGLLKSQAPWTIAMIGLYFSIGALMMQYFGAAGLITASMISTLIRCIFNQIYFKDHLFTIREAIPPMEVLIVYSLLGITAMASRHILGDTWKHFGFGVFQVPCRFQLEFNLKRVLSSSHGVHFVMED